MGVRASEDELYTAARNFAGASQESEFSKAERLRVAACRYARSKWHNDRARDRWKAKRHGLSYSPEKGNK